MPADDKPQPYFFSPHYQRGHQIHHCRLTNFSDQALFRIIVPFRVDLREVVGGFTNSPERFSPLTGKVIRSQADELDVETLARDASFEIYLLTGEPKFYVQVTPLEYAAAEIVNNPNHFKVRVDRSIQPTIIQPEWEVSGSTTVK